MPRGGEPDQLAAGVAGIGGAFGVPKLLQPVDRLAGGLFGDAKQAAHLAGGRPVQADRLHREPGAFRMACAFRVAWLCALVA